MELDRNTLAARLTAWTAFLSEELWHRQLAGLSVAEGLEAILAGPPAWVTRDTTGALRERRTDDGGWDAGWDTGPLLMGARGSGDADLMTLADHVEDLGADWMAH